MAVNDNFKYNFKYLLWPTLMALKALGGSGTNDEIVTKVIEIERISEYDQSVNHDERQTKIEYNIAWCRSYLKKMEAVNNSERGVWSITSLGEKMSKNDVIQGAAIVARRSKKIKTIQKTMIFLLIMKARKKKLRWIALNRMY